MEFLEQMMRLMQGFIAESLNGTPNYSKMLQLVHGCMLDVEAMKLKKQMDEALDAILSSKLKEQIQEVTKACNNNWEYFKEAIVQDATFLQENDEDIVKAVYRKLGFTDVLCEVEVFEGEALQPPVAEGEFCKEPIQAVQEEKISNLDTQDFDEGLDERRMPRQKTATQWDKAPYEVDELSTNEKSHIPDEVLAQIPSHIFIAKFRDEEGDNIKTTLMPREIWTLHRRPEVASAVRAAHLEQFFRLPPWSTDYMRAHEFHPFIPSAYDLIPKTKAIDNEKAFLKVKGSKFNYFDLIYSELELPLRLISQHLRVQKPPRYTEPFLHMAVVMALCVAERRQVRCDFAKYILESLIEANLKNSAKNKLYMNVRPMLTRVAYQALGMIEDLPAASSQAALIQQAKYVPKAVRTTSSAASSRSTRSKKSSSEEERTETNKKQDSQESAQEDMAREVEAAVPSEYKSDEEDTSILLERKSQKPRKTRPMTMEEARKIRIEKAKAIQKERRRIEADQKAQEEAEAAEAAQTQEKEVVDLSGTIEYLKKLEREKHIAEQRAAQLVREKIKEALSRKAEEPVLEPTQGSPKRPRQEEEEDVEHIQADPIPPSPISIPPAPPSSPIIPFPPTSTPQTPPSPSPLDIPKSPPAPTSPQQ
ncbi:hypothetical protein L7F22_006857 [Adiantum nelumboides]|nr:hypothetical protein [Adiantum nelumboides]